MLSGVQCEVLSAKVENDEIVSGAVHLVKFEAHSVTVDASMNNPVPVTGNFDFQAVKPGRKELPGHFSGVYAASKEL